MKTADAIKDFLRIKAAFCEPTFTIEPGFQGAIIGVLGKTIKAAHNGKITKKDDIAAFRHRLIGFLFSENQKSMSTKELTINDWYALSVWVDAHKDEVGGEWLSGNQELAQDVLTVLDAAARQDGQADMDFRAMLAQMGCDEI